MIAITSTGHGYDAYIELVTYRACDVTMGRFLWVMSSKIPTRIVTDHTKAAGKFLSSAPIKTYP